MAVSDASLGRALLVTAAGLFLLLAGWINTYTFLDEESAVYARVPHPQWALLACAAWGTCFVGGLITFTLYHIYPHL